MSFPRPRIPQPSAWTSMSAQPPVSSQTSAPVPLDSPLPQAPMLGQDILSAGDFAPTAVPAPGDTGGLAPVQPGAMMPVVPGQLQVQTNPDLLNAMPNGQYPGPGGANLGGMPELAPYYGYTDQNKNLLPNFVLNTPVDTQALDALQSRGLSQGPSPWLNLMNERTGMEETGLRDTALKNARLGESSAFNSAASHGGLSGGSAARIARQANTDRLLGLQGAAKFGALGRNTNAIEDERQKLQILQALPQQQLALSGFRSGEGRFNIGNQINDVRGQEGHNILDYTEKMKGYAAGQTADAIARSGGQPGLMDRALSWPQHWWDVTGGQVFKYGS